MFKNVKSGFSLVELSLVLIIVALIISAVISGKSLITNSKLTVLNSEMQTLKIALGNYINDEGITDYTSSDNDSDTKISLYKLMNKGYLEKDTVLSKSGSVSTATDADDVYKSKVNGGGWIYNSDGTNAGVLVTNAKNQTQGLLEETDANNFKKKYQKSGSINIDVGEGIKSETDDTATGKFVIMAEFLNGAQN